MLRGGLLTLRIYQFMGDLWQLKLKELKRKWTTRSLGIVL